MAGDRAGAERAFRAMTRHDETKLLGLHGLYIEAQRRNDAAAARRVAEEAAKAAPALAWAGQAVLDDRCAASDWSGALDALEHMKGTLDKADYRRKRAVLLTARALALNESDRDAALTAVLEAVKLAPDFVPAAALAGRRLAEADEWRKARRILEKAWAANPHPDIAEAYAHLRLADSARERLARVQKLAAMAPGNIEGALAVARAALDARDFAAARAALAPYLAAPTQRVAALMAAIEDSDQGDEGRVREWMSRAMRASGDPAWTADGVVSDRWLPVSPSGQLDGYQWRVPLAEIGIARPADRSGAAAGADGRAGSAIGRGRRSRDQRYSHRGCRTGTAGQAGRRKNRCRRSAARRQTGREGKAGGAGDPAGARARRSGAGCGRRHRAPAGSRRRLATDQAGVAVDAAPRARDFTPFTPEARAQRASKDTGHNAGEHRPSRLVSVPRLHLAGTEECACQST